MLQAYLWFNRSKLRNPGRRSPPTQPFFQLRESVIVSFTYDEGLFGQM